MKFHIRKSRISKDVNVKACDVITDIILNFKTITLKLL